MFSDTMFASKRAGKSVRHFTYSQVFATDFGWIDAHNLETESKNHLAFKELFTHVKVPRKMIVDGARSQVSGETRNICDMVRCTIVELEKGTPASNRVERMVQTIKMETRRDTIKSNLPMILWCYCIDRRVLIIRSCARNNYLLKGSVPNSFMLGEVTDISHVCYFKWYEWV